MMDAYVIRPAGVQDARGIAQVHVSAWREAYVEILPADYLSTVSVAAREEAWKKMLSQRAPHVLVAEIKDDIVGFVSYARSRDEDSTPETGEISAIYVAAARWSSGVGRSLWLEAKKGLSRQGYVTVTVWVLADNARAIRFYECAGLRVDQDATRQITIGGRVLGEFRYIGKL
jgi:ribosomal protein S18 acetylase RimI-like enzyme